MTDELKALVEQAGCPEEVMSFKTATHLARSMKLGFWLMLMLVVYNE